MENYGIFIFLMSVLTIVVVADLVAKKYLAGNSVYMYLIIFFTVGFVSFIGSKYFNLPVVGMRYGVLPEIGGSEAAVFAGKFFMICSFLGFLFYRLIRYLDDSDKTNKKD